MKKVIKLLLILGLVFTLTACGKETISLNDYLTVEVSGSNGTGTAAVTGFGDFEEALLQKLNDDISLMQLVAIEEGIDYELDKTSGLSNGDEVTLSIEIDEDIIEALDIKIVGKKETFKIENLPEKVYTDVDPFENLQIKYSDYSPYITAEVSSTQLLGIGERFTIEYPRAGSQYLQNGDTFTVKFTYDEVKAEDKGIRVVATEKEVQVEGFDSYITSWDDVSEETFNRVLKDVMDLAVSKKAETNFWIDGKLYRNPNWFKDEASMEIEYIGNYFFTPKASPNATYPAVYNSSFFVFTVTLANDNTREVETVYMRIYMKNLILTSDDYLVFDDTMINVDGWFLSSDRLYNQTVIANKANFICIENISYE